MATSGNDRVTSRRLELFAKSLWLFIKNTFAKKADLATVATSGSYDDLEGKPEELFFYCYYDTTTAVEIDAAVAAHKVPVLMQSGSTRVVQAYFAYYSQGVYYFMAAGATGPNVTMYSCGHVSTPQWKTSTANLIAAKANGDKNGNDITTTYVPVNSINLSKQTTTIAEAIKAEYPKELVKLWVPSNGDASGISDRPQSGYGFFVIAYLIRDLSSTDYKYAVTGFTNGRDNMYLAFITQSTGSCSWSQVGGATGDYVTLNSSQTITGIKTFGNSATNIVNPESTDHTRLRVIKPGVTNYNNGSRIQLEYDKGDVGRGLWDSYAGDVLWIGSDNAPMFHGTADNSAKVGGWTLHFNLRHTPVSQDMWFD